MSLVVHTGGDPRSLIAPVRAAVHGLDPRLPIAEVRTMDDIVGEAIAAPRFAMRLLGLFGVLALVLAAIGIYGIVSQAVASRAQELGIRAALGATPRDLVVLSLGAGVRQALVGVVLGVVAALAMSRAMAGMLHGVTPTDPLTFGVVVVVTATVAIAASLGPARRAGRVDPMAVLHEG
jgi:ABC-type antimicrobial peptide transport system permease subunit